MSRLPFVFVILFALIPAAGSNPIPQTDAPPTPNYAQSVEGYANQFNDILAAYRAGDRMRGLLLIEGYRVPDEQKWFSDHFPPEQAANLTERYDQVFTAFAVAMDSTIRDVTNNPGAAITSTLGKSTSETPEKYPSNRKVTGLKSVKETPLSICNFAIQINGNNSTSWARAVTYDQGAFRFVGSGAWPFWAWEDNTGLIDNTGGYFSRPPSIFDQTPPVYPDFAKRNHITGEVVLDALIGKDGSIKSVTPVSGNPALRQAAMDAVRQWRFTPGTIGGKTAEMEDRVTVTFSFGPPSKK